MSKFDKRICLSNIYALARERNIKIGDLEKDGGMSAGYLSRLSKDDNNSIPSIEFIAAVAEQLGVSIDALISRDFTQITPTESYLLKFLEKLVSDTDSDKLYWTKQTAQYLNTMEADEYGGSLDHPLFFIDWERGETEPQYWSRFDGERKVEDDCFVLQMTGHESLYLMCTTDSIGSSAYELYLVQRGAVHPLCQSKDSTKLFSDPLNTLYFSAAESCKHPKLNPTVTSVIDKFMSNSLDDDDDSDGLPF